MGSELDSRIARRVHGISASVEKRRCGPAPLGLCQLCAQPLQRRRASHYPGRPSWYRCVSCGSEALRPQPDDARLAEIYGPDYYAPTRWESAATLQRARGRTWLSALRMADPRPGARLLDVGCASGGFAELAVRTGLEVSGVDRHAAAIASAQRRVPAAVFVHGEIQAAAPLGLFDLITMFDFIEHVRDPIETLRHASRLLGRDGLLVISTPRAGSLAHRSTGRLWPQYREEHLHLLSELGIRTALGRAGFDVRQTSTTVKYTTGSYLVGQLAHYSTPIIERRAKRLRSLTCLPGMHALLPMRFGEMTVLARRQS